MEGSALKKVCVEYIGAMSVYGADGEPRSEFTACDLVDDGAQKRSSCIICDLGARKTVKAGCWPSTSNLT